MIPSTIHASEAAARALRSPDEVKDSSRNWAVMVEKVLEDSPHIDDLMILQLLVAIIVPIYGFTRLCPSEEMLAVFKSSIRNMLLGIMRYARKRNLMDESEEKDLDLDLVGYGTWKFTGELDVWKKIELEFFKHNESNTGVSRRLPVETTYR